MNLLATVKICRVATVPFFLLTQLKVQVLFLQERGAEVTMVSSYGPEVEQILDADIPHVDINIARSISPLRDLRSLWCLYRFFRQQRFDIVHSTTPKAGLLTCIAGFAAGVSIRLHTFTGQQWVTMAGFTRFVSRLSDSCIGYLNTSCFADSDSQRKFLIKEGLLAPQQIKVIGNGSLAGVDLVRFHPGRWSVTEKELLKEQLGISSSAIVLIFIGRISQEKGVLELLDSFCKVRDCQRYEVELLLLGPLDVDCGGGGCEVSEELLQQEGVHYVGYRGNPENFLAISDLFCLPSYREGFGTVVIEAAAMGVPTLGSKINGLVDAVVDGETGVLVPPKDASLYHQALCDLLDDPLRLRRLGEAARARCLSLFDASLVNALLVEEYQKLLLNL